MTDLEVWLAERRPMAPPEMSDALRSGPGEGTFHERLRTAAVRSLDAARTGEGAARSRAFPLLSADAFLTYACEAALESPDADGALVQLMRLEEASP